MSIERLQLGCSADIVQNNTQVNHPLALTTQLTTFTPALNTICFIQQAAIAGQLSMSTLYIFDKIQTRNQRYYLSLSQITPLHNAHIGHTES